MRVQLNPGMHVTDYRQNSASYGKDVDIISFLERPYCVTVSMLS